MFEKKLNKTEIILSVIIAIFSVIFLWWFWSNWWESLWLNASVFWFFILAYYLIWIKDYKKFFKTNFFWFIPISFLILSFSIYENPYLKSINIWLIPISTIFFLGFWITKFEWSKIWNFKMISKVIFKKLKIWKAINVLSDTVNKGKANQVAFKKIFIWIAILAAITPIILSILTSADEKFRTTIEQIWNNIDSTIILRIAFAIIMLVVLTALKISWNEKPTLTGSLEEKKIDSIISWIVLGWTLCIYLLFVYVQIDSIITNELPANVNEVANLVKNWFWQLFFISIINIIFFFVYYKKTSGLVQNMLIAFIFASIIILASAWNRMIMYVQNYWFSYEKFTASYTVIFFWILFIIMLSVLFLKKKADILKISLILALWMYSFLNIFPMEVAILKINLAVSEKENTKIDPYQSHMLSMDIMSSVKSLKWEDIYTKQSWMDWTKESIREIACKKWYEKNIHDFYDYKELGVSDEEMAKFKERCEK